MKFTLHHIAPSPQKHSMLKNMENTHIFGVIQEQTQTSQSFFTNTAQHVEKYGKHTHFWRNTGTNTDKKYKIMDN